MDYLAPITFLPLRFAGNQLIENVSSPDGITNRANLIYRLDIYKPKAYQSGTYVVHESLRGREAPAYFDSGMTFSEGCDFDLSEFVWGLLEVSAPKASQNSITIQPLAIMPYYTKSWVEPYQNTSETSTGIKYLVRGRLNEESFAAWKESFFTVYLAQKRGFFTWQPIGNKLVDRNQPEFLSYLVHHNPAPTQLKVRVDVEFSDGTTHATTLTPITLSNVNNYSLYTVPVGFEALGLDELETETDKEVLAYTVWLSNQNTQALTETRRYVVNNDYEPYVRHLVFLNSLGGWDTLRLFGVSKEILQVSSLVSQRKLEANYTPSSEELFVNTITGERRLTLATGFQPSREWLQYLEEIFWAEKIYVNTSEGLVPIVLAQNTFEAPDDEENFGGRTFQFKRSKIGKGYSALPSAPVFNNYNRPTEWVGIVDYCLVNDFGVRTGFKSYSMLELRYSDGLKERVSGIPRKSNSPETEGYIAPVLSESCVVTPYLNELITGVCNFVKNDCGVGYTGQAPIITISAGQYGSETSQIEAQMRAQAAFDSLNTQSYANLNGTCLLNIVYQSAAISRASNFTRNNCGTGNIGSNWTITVAQGAYTSTVSQAAANALAVAYADSVDTQANANVFGSCTPGENYSVSVPTGSANYRFFLNKGSSFYLAGTGFQTPYIPTSTHYDVLLSSTQRGADTTFYAIHSAAFSGTAYVYKNGTLWYTVNYSYTSVSYSQNLFNIPATAAGDLIFVKLL